MSALSELLQAKATKLNKTQTIVTTRSGKKVIEKEGKLYESKEGELTEYKPSLSSDEAETQILIEAAIQPDLYAVPLCPGLFLGSQDAAVNIEGLKQKNVTHILNVATGIPDAFPSLYTYCNVPLLDSDDSSSVVALESALQRCFDFIESAFAQQPPGSVLCHCNAGVSRSASVCLAYMMKKSSLSYDDAFRLLKQSKPDIRPNDGFRDFLKNNYLII